MMKAHINVTNKMWNKWHKLGVHKFTRHLHYIIPRSSVAKLWDILGWRLVNRHRMKVLNVQTTKQGVRR